ncbi:hypothetical protein DKK70_01595 [Gilliamella apicola]|uniref:Uncharacterized protein n=1 Tax=Gilliamella apicola TaxID=1196095 RepID=A0A2V4E997_9GAMM|nr:hypothetical protein DKK70_01595 [Gilliamella apicola]
MIIILILECKTFFDFFQNNPQKLGNFKTAIILTYCFYVKNRQERSRIISSCYFDMFAINEISKLIDDIFIFGR